MEPDHFTFASYESTGNALGLANAWECTLNLRSAGHRTRLATRRIGNTFVHTVVSEPPSRPNREARGCNILAPYLAQAKRIATMYNALAEAERRPDLEG